jgi:hypothetical protein
MLDAQRVPCSFGVHREHADIVPRGREQEHAVANPRVQELEAIPACPVAEADPAEPLRRSVRDETPGLAVKP